MNEEIALTNQVDILKMLKLRNVKIVLILISLGLTGCVDSVELSTSGPTKLKQENQSAESTVADDVLFLVLGKMALYDQLADGKITLRNHHFVAEIMPKAGRKIISGTLVSAVNQEQVLQFEDEGSAFLAHGARVMDPQELHKLHPDGEYIFSYQTYSGYMAAQSITLLKRSVIEQMPAAARVTLSQNAKVVLPSKIDHGADLNLSWDPMPGNTRVVASDLDDLIFVLAFDCFGNNIAHSGRPYQGGPYLSYKDSQYVIPAASLEPGMKYTAIVEQATADVQSFLGVPGIATYATLTFIKFQTSGEVEGEACPIDIR